MVGRPEFDRTRAVRQHGPIFGNTAKGVEVTMRGWCLGVVAGLLVGCGTTYIPNTNVEDTSENRKVIEFCEVYRHAMEEKDVGKLLAMASPRYHDDAGTPSGDDDTDYDASRLCSRTASRRTTAIRYEIKYQEVVFAENNHVVCKLQVHGELPRADDARRASGTTRWPTTSSISCPTATGYKIIAGM